MGPFEDGDCFGRKFNVPFICGDVKDAEGTSSTKPTFCHFFKILQTVDDVSLGVFVGEVEKVDGTCGVGDINDNIADLLQSITSFVYAQELGDSGSSLCANLAGRDMWWQWCIGLGIFQERPIEVNDQ